MNKSTLINLLVPTFSAWHDAYQMSKPTLHPLQSKLIELLSQHSDDPLTIRQLKEKLTASSTSLVAHHLKQLEKKGYLKKNPYNPRDYQVIIGTPERPISYLNLYGLASCGPSGSLLEGHPEQQIPIASRLLNFPASQAFMVRARGESMEPRIHADDLIIAQITNDIRDGRVCVCVNEGECFIKLVRKDKEGRILLVSFNPKFPPFVATDSFHVEGEVKGIISGKI